MYTFERKAGRILHGDVFVCRAQSGQGPGLNNPALEHVSKVGPLPRGKYHISHDVETSAKHGPYILRLTPFPENEMYGRSGFLLHGLKKEHPELSSEGCICASPVKYRQQIHESGDDIMEVV